MYYFYYRGGVEQRALLPPSRHRVTSKHLTSLNMLEDAEVTNVSIIFIHINSI
ncbi:hypothetical protein JCM21714_4687 [Gracilibacillus boraciitolerans JCM 21714]|uniref:Uncharacterized protein n=1 Tax=Gracilibacillus boraciitolerans JCM 21714 TaxID=1298598 RepID=W4VQG5_9BACI|nr:hypothetical protein JCM21714_4687 [Gracilibacillus boraciitolerans JCM 21714]